MRQIGTLIPVGWDTHTHEFGTLKYLWAGSLGYMRLRHSDTCGLGRSDMYCLGRKDTFGEGHSDTCGLEHSNTCGLGHLYTCGLGSHIHEVWTLGYLWALTLRYMKLGHWDYSGLGHSDT